MSWTWAIHKSRKWRVWAGAVIQAWAYAAQSHASGCCHSLHRTLHPLPTAGKAADIISVILYWCCFLVCQPQSWSLVSQAALVKLVHFFSLSFLPSLFTPSFFSPLFSHLSPIHCCHFAGLPCFCNCSVPQGHFKQSLGGWLRGAAFWLVCNIIFLGI